MNTTKLKELIPEDASESVQLADEYTPFVFSDTSYQEQFTSGGIYLFAAPNTPDLERCSTELAVRLSHDAPVVLVNSCIEDHRMRVHLKHAGAATQPIQTIPLDDGSLALRYEKLCEWIEARNAKALVINCFENAASTARHQVQLTQLLHQLRNKYEIAIFVFSSQPMSRLKLCRNTRRGALGQLTFLAAMMLEAGSQLTITEQADEPPYKAFMKEHQKTIDDNPPPKPDINKIPCEEFTDYIGGVTIQPEDLEREWAVGEMMNDELGMMNEGEGKEMQRICHSERNAVK